MPAVVQLKTVLKARALVVRALSAQPGPELLVLDHPLTRWQVPGGGIEPGEGPAQAAVRELFEESGLDLGPPIAELPLRDVIVPGGSFGELDYEYQRWHGFVFAATPHLPATWVHQVTGEGIDAPSRFAFRWSPLDAGVLERFEPRFRPLVRLLIRHLDRAS